MTRSLLVAGCAVVVLLPAPAIAQMHMYPGIKMDMPADAPKAKPKPKPKVVVPAGKAKPKPALSALSASPTEAGAQAPTVETEKQALPAQASETRPRPLPGRGERGDTMPEDHSMHSMQMPPATSAKDHSMRAMPGMTMSAAVPAYTSGSGTARNPGADNAAHGLHVMAGDWSVMAHGFAWATYTDQGGPRGDSSAFVTSMAMLTANRSLGDGARLTLRSMLSLEPLLGRRGYPNLFATGETADGATALIDRQHPHDLFMELAARIDVDAGSGSVFVYAAPVGEPAIGPSAFMMRASARYQSLSPITHHWFDSTHISYGVVTAGYAAPKWQIEASGFRGREPDQYRWDIERLALDSWSVRATWTPSPAWAMQISHARLKSPEQLEPFRDEARTTASVQYAHKGLSALLAFSNKHKLPGRALTAWLGEVNWEFGRHDTLFARAENVANDELFPNPADPLHDRTFRVSKLESGYAYRMPLAGPVELALGGAVGVYDKPAALDAAYGRFPLSFSLFAKVSLGH